VLQRANCFKVIEYTKFQPGAFMDFLAHPRKTSRYISTVPLQVNLQRRSALVVAGHLDAETTYTAVQDIAHVVARAVDYQGVWPTVGGIRGHRISARRLVEIVETVLGREYPLLLCDRLTKDATYYCSQANQSRLSG
jgi:hypothetical protein